MSKRRFKLLPDAGANHNAKQHRPRKGGKKSQQPRPSPQKERSHEDHPR